MFFNSLKLAIPSIIGAIILQFQELINLYYAAHSDNEALISAIGLGNVIMSCFVISVFLSMNSAIETLVSQAAGNGNYQVCGLYLNQGLFVISLTFLFLCALLLNTDMILTSIG